MSNVLVNTMLAAALVVTGVLAVKVADESMDYAQERAGIPVRPDSSIRISFNQYQPGE